MKYLSSLLTLLFTMALVSAQQNTATGTLQVPMQQYELSFSKDMVSITDIDVRAADKGIIGVLGYDPDVVSFSLISPEGLVITESNAQSLGWETTFFTSEETRGLLPPISTLFLINEDIASGTYRLQLQLLHPADLELNVIHLAVGYHEPVIRTAMHIGAIDDPRLIFSQAEDIPVFVAVFEDATPVEGASISVDAMLQGENSTTFRLYDNGAGIDKNANDGIYSGIFQPDHIGLWQIYARNELGQVIASDNTLIATPDLRLSGTVTDQGLDDDLDGRIDAVQLTFETIGSATSDFYFISAKLENDKGEIVSLSDTIKKGEPLSLAYPVINPIGDSDFIFTSTTLGDIEAGSYEIMDVRLESAEENRLLDYYSNMGSTANYDGRLERKNTIINEIKGFEGIDTDHDGYFNSLEVTVEVDILIAGNYGVSAKLVDGDSRVLDTASILEVSLDSTIQEITLTFDGTYISAFDFAAPMEIINLLVYPHFEASQDTTALKDNVGFISLASDAFNGQLPNTIDHLIAFIENLKINKRGNAANALRHQWIRVLERAQKELDEQRNEKALDHLRTLENKIHAQAGKALSVEDSNLILESLSLIKMVIYKR